MVATCASAGTPAGREGLSTWVGAGGTATGAAGGAGTTSVGAGEAGDSLPAGSTGETMELPTRRAVIPAAARTPALVRLASLTAGREPLISPMTATANAPKPRRIKNPPIELPFHWMCPRTSSSVRPLDGGP